MTTRSGTVFRGLAAMLIAVCAVTQTLGDEKAPSVPPTPASTAAPAAPATVAGTGSVAVRLTVSDQDLVPELVIFLAPADETRRFAAPTTPIKLSQKNAVFSPSVLVICAGQTVDFMNDEERQIEHNIFSQSPAKKFDLGLYGPGTTKSITFDEPGPVRLYCSVHRYMDGVIFVSPTPFFTKVTGLPPLDATILNVPPGEYYVKTWQKRKRWVDASSRVTVTADKQASVAIELTRP